MATVSERLEELDREREIAKLQARIAGEESAMARLGIDRLEKRNQYARIVIWPVTFVISLLIAGIIWLLSLGVFP